MNYAEFLDRKAQLGTDDGFEPVWMPDFLYDFQRDLVAWALRKGRAAIFADCGLGKTPMQLVWAENVRRHTKGQVLILAPLAVSQQTLREAARFGIDCAYVREPTRGAGIIVTNYEMLDRFDPRAFAGIVLDESSILKSYDGKLRTEIIEGFSDTPHRLACTATPAPNDWMELANHAQFVGAMGRAEMLATFFVHDGGSTQDWRLKGHAESDFWRWVCSWSIMLKRPSDLGYADNGFNLPALSIRHDEVPSDEGMAEARGRLFNLDARTLEERREARKATIGDRVSRCAALVNGSAEPWLVWCNLNDEGHALSKAIPDAVEVAGSDTLDEKADRMLGFAEGRYRVLISKPSICGFGMNFQRCARMAFVGLSDSYEQFYQATRRCWRFGQKREVQVHVITSDIEREVVRNIERKEGAARKMGDEMLRHMADISAADLHGTTTPAPAFVTRTENGHGWEMRLGDCVEEVRKLDTDSIHYSIFSPPFASLYTYSASPRDMGNCADTEAFYRHFSFLVPELLRVTMPGRLLSFHCMNLPTSKARDGLIGITDFRGELIRAFVAAGWIYHSEVVIWKDPVTAMQRTKALGLLYKQLRKDSCMSRQGIPDYLVTMRKPGDNPERVTKTHESFPVGLWQRYASPVWMDINPSETLQRDSAREERDERHIAPLQLEVIRRAVQLWSNPGDLVLSPFAGIGSEGYEALKAGRKFLGIELKASYYAQAVLNLATASTMAGEPELAFDEAQP